MVDVELKKNIDPEEANVLEISNLTPNLTEGIHKILIRSRLNEYLLMKICGVRKRNYTIFKSEFHQNLQTQPYLRSVTTTTVSTRSLRHFNGTFSAPTISPCPV